MTTLRTVDHNEWWKSFLLLYRRRRPDFQENGQSYCLLYVGMQRQIPWPRYTTVQGRVVNIGTMLRIQPLVLGTTSVQEPRQPGIQWLAQKCNLYFRRSGELLYTHVLLSLRTKNAQPEKLHFKQNPGMNNSMVLVHGRIVLLGSSSVIKVCERVGAMVEEPRRSETQWLTKRRHRVLVQYPCRTIVARVHRRVVKCLFDFRFRGQTGIRLPARVVLTCVQGVVFRYCRCNNTSMWRLRSKFEPKHFWTPGGLSATVGLRYDVYYAGLQCETCAANALYEFLCGHRLKMKGEARAASKHRAGPSYAWSRY